MKQFFTSDASEFLQVRLIGSAEYIGKAADSGVSLVDLGNMLMNVKTMLRMICPNFSFPDDAIKILALTSIPSRSYY